MPYKKLVIYIFTTLTFFCIVHLNNAAIAMQLTHLQVKSEQNHWRFIFDATDPIQFHCSIQNNPTRLVIALNQSSPVLSFNPESLINTPVSQIGWNYLGPRKMSMVLDLRRHIRFKAYAVTPSETHGHQLIVEFNAPEFSKLSNTPSPLPSPPEYANFNTEQIYAKPINIKPKIVANSNNKRSKNIIIVIDAGHGGKDPGTTGMGGTQEKNVVLHIAKQLYEVINRQKGFQAVLTRNGDYYLTLRERLAFARKYNADMFISIHADAYKNHYASGASVYALSLRGATGEAARWLAARENESELKGGVKLSDKDAMLKSVLINLSQSATIQSSLLIGHQIMHALLRITELHHHKVEQAAFVVLKSPDIPSLLVETGFLSNPKEERRLNNSRYRIQLANALMEGIRLYFKQERK